MRAICAEATPICNSLDVLYFDHNATHPLSRVAREAWLDASERYIGNPSSPHRLGSRASSALEEAREKLAGWLGCGATEIVWTSGATEANNAVLRSASIESEGQAWISAIEHPCVIEAGRQYFPGRHSFIPVTSQGVVDLDWVSDGLKTDRPALVAMMAANNETGVVQPWRDMRDLCRKWGVPLLCDAAQWIGKEAANGLGDCDFMSGCAHKFGGPAGIGFLKVAKGFHPLIVGGQQEDGRRSGTENLPGVVAGIAALEARIPDLTDEFRSNRQLVREGFEAALKARLPGVEILGADTKRLWNTVSAVMPETPDCRQRWVVKLDKLGFAVSTGSACASGKEMTSHVLTAMGVEPTRASRVLRFSSGWETEAADWDALLEGIFQAARELSA